MIITDERTRKILELFGVNIHSNDNNAHIFNLDENDFYDNVLNMSLNEGDNLRIFRYFAELYSNMHMHGLNDDNHLKDLCVTIKESLEDTKMFVLSDKVKNLIVNIPPPKIKEQLRLPFKNFFIDADFKRDYLDEDNQVKPMRIFGILVEWDKMYKYLDILKSMERLDILDKKFPVEKTVCISFVWSDGRVLVPHEFLFDLDTGNIRPKLKSKTAIKPLYYNDMEKYIAKIVTNLLLFFNEPRVVTYIHERNSNSKRIKRGKVPIPSEIRTRINSELTSFIEKIYMNSGNQNKLSYAFWVMGHNRVLKSAFFKHKQGQKLWISAHLRGEGLQPPQVFEII